jgi:dTDP-4-dehydrorhamnose reductase
MFLESFKGEEMRALVTGMHGMIAPKIKKYLEQKKVEVIAWDRLKHPIDNVKEVNKYLLEVGPDIIFHLAYGDVLWAEEMAKYCFLNNRKFIYISTVNVYGDTIGPLTKNSIVSPNNDYSNYKKLCEDSILRVNVNSYILRLGWQISEPSETHPNNMVSYILRQKNSDNELEANSNSYISASFNDDCAKKIVDISFNSRSGLYLINSNLNLNFYQMLNLIVKKYGLDVKIIESKGEEKNWIMLDEKGFIDWDLD